jgi:FRG domain
MIRAPDLTEGELLNLRECYFTVQHFDAPTRLLAWTKRALIAPYFAVRDSRGENDAAIWALWSVVAK